MTANTSFNVNAIRDKWMAILTKPSEAAFDAERPNVNLMNAIIWLAIAGAIYGFFSGIGNLLFRSGGIGAPITGLIGGLIFLPIGYLIGEGILYLIARALGGIGDFNTQAYLQSLYTAPLYMVIGVASIIPFLGGLVGLLAGLYSLYLTTLSLKVTHHYDTTKAVLTWAIPAVVLFVIGACMAIFFASIFAAMLGGAMLSGH